MPFPPRSLLVPNTTFYRSQPRGSVVTSSHHPAVVRAEGHGVNRTLMAFEHDELGGGIGRFQIPQPRGSVVTSSHHPTGVRLESHHLNLTLIAFWHEQLGGG